MGEWCDSTTFIPGNRGFWWSRFQGILTIQGQRRVVEKQQFVRVMFCFCAALERITSTLDDDPRCDLREVWLLRWRARSLLETKQRRKKKP